VLFVTPFDREAIKIGNPHSAAVAASGPGQGPSGRRLTRLVRRTAAPRGWRSRFHDLLFTEAGKPHTEEGAMAEATILLRDNKAIATPA
jgi:hypothetical protein